MSKIYCYVDESGQDTRGSFFTITVFVISKNKEQLGNLIEEIETKTGKRNIKWNKAIHSKRMDYLRKLISEVDLQGKLFYSVYQGIEYDYFAILSIAKVINKINIKKNQKISIYIDGLTKTRAMKYGSELRKLGVKNCKVKGVRKDENNVFIRVADSLAGLIRLSIYKKDSESIKIFNKMTKLNALDEV